MTPALRQVLSRPGWVLPHNPSLQIDFAGNRAWNGFSVVPPESLLTVSRASVAYQEDLFGNWREWPANTLRFSDKGALIEGARTNLALWCRDLTNAAWAKVMMTADLTATGIDGVANSATTITATDALSTILQTVVQASTADTVSFFVRRRTGTGTVEVTADGAAFADITAALAVAATATSGAWYRATVSATLVNPVLGFRITTSGDAVDVDFAQLEAGTFVSSPILTTAGSVARATDVVSVTHPPNFGGEYTILAKGKSGPVANNASSPTLLQVSASVAASSNRIICYISTAGNGVVNINNAVLITTQAWATDLSRKLLVSVKNGRQAASFNGGAIGTAANASPSTIDNIFIGSQGSNALWNSYVESIVVWPRSLLPDEVLRFLSGQ